MKKDHSVKKVERSVKNPQMKKMVEAYRRKIAEAIRMSKSKKNIIFSTPRESIAGKF